MRCVTVIALFVTFAINSQVKDDISVVQYSAEFVKSSEISLNTFKNYKVKDRSLLLNYFMKHKLKSLIENINDF